MDFIKNVFSHFQKSHNSFSNNCEVTSEKIGENSVEPQRNNPNVISDTTVVNTIQNNSTNNDVEADTLKKITKIGEESVCVGNTYVSDDINNNIDDKAHKVNAYKTAEDNENNKPLIDNDLTENASFEASLLHKTDKFIDTVNNPMEIEIDSPPDDNFSNAATENPLSELIIESLGENIHEEGLVGDKSEGTLNLDELDNFLNGFDDTDEITDDNNSNENPDSYNMAKNKHDIATTESIDSKLINDDINTENLPILNLDEFYEIFNDFSQLTDTEEELALANGSKANHFTTDQKLSQDSQKADMLDDKKIINEIETENFCHTHDNKTQESPEANLLREENDSDVKVEHTITEIKPVQEGQNYVLYEVSIFSETVDNSNVLATSFKNEHLEMSQDDDKSSIITISSTEEVNLKNDTKDIPNHIDTISIISTEAEADSDNCSYHSSDFEFISESDAVLDGLIVNCVNKDLKTPNKNTNDEVYTLEIAKDRDYVSSSSQESENSHCLPETSEGSRGIFTKEYSNIGFDNVLVNQEQDYAQSHKIPEGDDYLNLFQGLYAPLVSELYFLENKSVRPTTCMNVQYNGIGFDARMHRRNDSEDEEDEDAKESAKKILSMYPYENRKRRRRF